MFILVDAIAHVVLFLIELFLLALGQVTVVSGHIGLLLILNILFAILYARSLAGRQRTILDAIRDPVLLVRLTGVDFVDARMTRIDLTRSRAGSVAVLGLSSGGTNKQETTRCQD